MGRRSNPSRRALCAAGLTGALLLATAATAMGQAAVDQYVPSAKPGGQHGSAADAIREATGLSASAEPGGPGAKAEKSTPLSVTHGPRAALSDDGGGYPLTTFVIVVILLLVAGLLARYLPDLIRRLRQHS